MGVLGSIQSVIPNTYMPSQSTESGELAPQRSPAQGSGESQSPCLPPRASTIKEQGFSDQVAAQIEAPQRSGPCLLDGAE